MGGERLWLIGANALQKNRKGEVFRATKPGTTDLLQAGAGLPTVSAGLHRSLDWWAVQGSNLRPPD